MTERGTSEPISIAYRLEYDDVIALTTVSRSHLLGLRYGDMVRLYRAVFAILAIGYGLFIYLRPDEIWLGQQMWATTFLMGLFLAVFGWALLPGSQRRRIVKFSKAYQKLPAEVTIDFDGTGARVRMDDISADLPWSKFENAEETAQYFFLKLARLRGLIVPKRGIAGERDLAGLRKLIASNVHYFSQHGD